jgi:hypothetical protein
MDKNGGSAVMTSFFFAGSVYCNLTLPNNNSFFIDEHILRKNIVCNYGIDTVFSTAETVRNTNEIKWTYKVRLLPKGRQEHKEVLQFYILPCDFILCNKVRVVNDTLKIKFK